MVNEIKVDHLEQKGWLALLFKHTDKLMESRIEINKMNQACVSPE